MEISLADFIKQRKDLAAIPGPIKIVVKTQKFEYVLTGEVKQVYEELRELSRTTKLTESTILVLIRYRLDLSEQVFAWIDELPGLLEAAKLEYQEDHKELFDRIETLYSEVYTELEQLTISLDEYLQGRADEPSLVEIGRKVHFLELLSLPGTPELLSTDWFTAVSENRVDTVNLLLWNGQDPNVLGPYLDTALHLASKNGHTELVKLLLENGIDMNVQDNEDNTALHLASKHSHTEIAEILLKAGANQGLLNMFDDTAFDVASMGGHTELVKLFLKYGYALDVKSEKAFMILFYAIKYGYIEIVKLLLDYGVDPDIRFHNGTNLSVATCLGSVVLVKLLLERGANPDAQNNKGQTALHLACADSCKDRRYNIIKLLIKHGAKTDIRDINGHTCLEYASPEDSEEILKFLREEI